VSAALLDRKATALRLPSASPARRPQHGRDVLPPAGKPLEPATRATMERRFHHDFGGVRIHTDRPAAASAEGLGAAAYTVGQHVVFGAGRYAPHTPAGDRLLAHELAHAVQQKAAASASPVGPPSPAREREAETAAEAVTRGGPVSVQATGGLSIQRQPLQGAGSNVAPSSDALTENASPFLAAVIASTTLDGYETGSPAFKLEHRKELETIAHRMVVLLRKYSRSTVTVTGFADTVGTDESNMALGQFRAAVVKGVLVELGVPEGIISTDSKGEGPPQAVKTRDATPQPKNRRVIVQFHPEAGPTLPVPPPSAGPASSGPGFKESPSYVDRLLGSGPLPLPGTADLPGPRATHLPPDFWKPLPPPIKGTGPKSALDLINEKLVDPVVDAVTKPLPKAIRDKVRDAAHDGVKAGIAKAARMGAEAAGLHDPQGLDAIEKAAEAAIQEKGQSGPK
jgi:outer membrane protein OmpA-like peptidoglycan-associated protein